MDQAVVKLDKVYWEPSYKKNELMAVESYKELSTV